MPQPVRRPDPSSRRREPDERSGRGGRSSRADRDERPPRDDRGSRSGRSSARDDRDDRDRRASRGDRPARDEYAARDEYTTRDDRSDRGSRGSRSGGAPARGGRDSAADRYPDDERGSRSGGRDGSERRSNSLPADRARRNDRYVEPEPTGYTDDSIAVPAFTDDSIAVPTFTDDSIAVPTFTQDSLEAPVFTEDSLEAPVYPPERNRRDTPSRGRSGDSSGRRDDYTDRPDRSAPGRPSRPGRGDPRDPRLPDPLDDPRAPRSLRYGDQAPLRDPRDPRSPSRYPDGAGARDPRDPRGSGASGGRSRSRADYPPYADGASGPSAPGGRREPRDRGAPDSYGGRGAPSGAGSFGAPGGAAGGGRYAQDEAWAPGGKAGVAGRAANSRGQAPGAVDDAPTTKKPNRQRQIALVLMIILGLAVIGGVGYKFAPASIKNRIHHLLGSSPTTSAPTPPPFATYTPGPTPTALANDKINSSASLRYVINYPTTWLLGSTSSTTSGQYDNLETFTSPGSNTRITVEAAGAFAGYTAAQIIQGEVTAASQGGATFSPITSATRTQAIGGEVWQRQEYTVNLTITPTPSATATATAAPTTTQLHLAILATHHLGRGYVIILQSSVANFAKDDTSTFEPLLATFRFS